MNFVYPWLQDQSTIILCRPSIVEIIIEKTMNQFLANCQYNSGIYFFDFVTSTFFWYSKSIKNSRYYISDSQTFSRTKNKITMEELCKIIDKRLFEMARNDQSVFLGYPTYIFWDNFSIESKKNLSSFVHLLTRAQQANLRITAFNDPASFIADNTALFSSVITFPGYYTKKYSGYLPLKEINNLKSNEYYVCYKYKSLPVGSYHL